jgi:hypothetical protein
MKAIKCKNVIITLMHPPQNNRDISLNTLPWHNQYILSKVNHLITTIKFLQPHHAKKFTVFVSIVISQRHLILIQLEISQNVIERILLSSTISIGKRTSLMTVKLILKSISMPLHLRMSTKLQLILLLRLLSRIYFRIQTNRVSNQITILFLLNSYSRYQNSSNSNSLYKTLSNLLIVWLVRLKSRE